MNLYNISTEYQMLMNQDEYTGEEIEMLEKLDHELETKANAIAAVIKNIEAECESVTNARKLMQEREAKLSHKADILREYLKLNLERCGIDNITSSPYFTIKVKTNPPSLFVEQEDLIPDVFWDKKEVKVLIKDKLKSLINEGVIIPGCKMIRKTRLEIK